MSYDYLILKQLKKKAKAAKGFHVPGHKGRGAFKKLFPVASFDVTELSYSDNLASPSGVIERAQRDIAEILGAKKSYILTDGSTCGVMAMTYVASGYGRKIIVPRNSHVSVWNACALFGLEPVIVQGETRDGIMLPPSPAAVERLVSVDKTIAGMIVASPDYYGNIAPLSEYREILSRYSRIFLVDGAHGAHLAFEPEKQGYAGLYADMWVDGAHKSLPTLTQGAVVSVNNAEYAVKLEEALAIFRTTSPSYPVMASVEYGVKYLANNVKICETAKAARREFAEKFPDLKIYPSDDWTKLLIDFAPLGISADKAAAALEKRHIYCEFSDGRYILFYLSPMTTVKELLSLGSALTKVISAKKLKSTYVARPAVAPSARTYSFQYALRSEKESVPLKSAAGRMCARSAGLTPPCVPVVAAGEIITDAAVSLLRSAKNTFGITDGNITVVKK